jgi:hypothetical protein
MFNTYIRNPPIHKTVTTTIHEHRAPTDESIRLASELREKIENEFLAHIKCENNVLNAKWDVFRNPEGFGTIVIFSCAINGTEHRDKVVLPYNADSEYIINAIRGIIDRVFCKFFLRDISSVSIKILECIGRC